MSNRRRNYDSVAALVADKVDSSKGRISAKRLLPAARAAGYDARRATFAGWSQTPSSSGGEGSRAAVGLSTLDLSWSRG